VKALFEGIRMTEAWKKFTLVGALVMVWPSTQAHAQQAQSVSPTKLTVPGYTMPATHMWEMTSDSGETYRIFVSYPSEGGPPKGGYPVLYVLDGNAIFAGFAETRRMLEGTDVGKSIVVGVGYPTDKAYDMRRLYDLTGGPPPAPWDTELGKERSGGWEKFLDFLTGKLRTEIGKRYKIDLKRQALFGHSLGGLFALHALFTRGDAFHAIIAASPSLFWHKQEMLKEEQAFSARLQAGKIPNVSRLMVVAGELEETTLERLDPEQFAKRMEPLSAYGLRSRSETYAGEGHMTVPSRAVTQTLRFAFSWP
jgi:predicted alpha/beta superfamily hydrolase